MLLTSNVLVLAGYGVAAVRVSLAAGGPDGDEQHQDHLQGGGPQSGELHPQPAGLWQCHHLQHWWEYFTPSNLMAFTPVSALKEAKAISVPTAKYSEEGLPTTQLDYGSVPDQDIITQSSSTG